MLNIKVQVGRVKALMAPLCDPLIFIEDVLSEGASRAPSECGRRGKLLLVVTLSVLIFIMRLYVFTMTWK